MRELRFTRTLTAFVVGGALALWEQLRSGEAPERGAVRCIAWLGSRHVA
jgi:hypothetical protein